MKSETTISTDQPRLDRLIDGSYTSGYLQCLRDIQNYFSHHYKFEVLRVTDLIVKLGRLHTMIKEKEVDPGTIQDVIQ